MLPANVQQGESASSAAEEVESEFDSEEECEELDRELAAELIAKFHLEGTTVKRLAELIGGNSRQAAHEAPEVAAAALG